jgi:hypothetical protein
MTRRTFDRRLSTAEVIVGSRPVSPSAIDDLYSRFLRTGELPSSRKAAWGVLQRSLCARRGGRVSYQENHRPLAGPPREQVFREAVHEHDTARDAARLLIEILVEAGDDPSDPEFIPSDYEHPGFGSISLYILGWPDAWVKPPYEKQMERVLRQHAQLRAVASERSEWWWQEAAGALSAFMTRGEIPVEPEHRLFALTVAEMFAIQAHYFGRGDEDLIAAFAETAATTGKQRDEALVRLGRLQASVQAQE